MQRMRKCPLTFALIGAGMMLLISVGYVLVGPKDSFGFPEPLWAAIFFYPGTYMGFLTWEHVAHSMPVCYAAAVATITLIGAVLGALLDFLIALGNGGRSD